MIDTFHLLTEIAAGSVESHFIRADGCRKQRFNIEMTGPEWIADSMSLTHSFELSTIVITPAGPQPVFAVVRLFERFTASARLRALSNISGVRVVSSVQKGLISQSTGLTRMLRFSSR